MDVKRTCQRPTKVRDSLDTIIAELDTKTNVFPEGAVRRAQRRKGEIVPALINLIEKATLAAQAGVRPTGHGHFFALFLLTEFQAKEALPAILDVLKLPGEAPYRLFGDAVTECHALARLAIDSPRVIDDLISDRSVDEFIRWVAAQTFLYWVRDGHMTRDEAVRRLNCHLDEAIVNQDRAGATPLVFELLKYGPDEVVETIGAAFAQGLIDPERVERDCVEASLSDPQSCLEESFKSLPPAGPTDTIELLRNWAYFQDSTDNSDVIPCVLS